MARKRMPAQWEVQDFIQLTFPNPDSDWKDQYLSVIQTYIEIITAITPYQKILLLCESIKDTKEIIPTALHAQIIWIAMPTNDTWCRDYGGITIYEGQQKKLLDFTFNGWGNKFVSNLDNQSTKQLFNSKSLSQYKYKKLNFVLEGGSIESNGAGILLTTKQCLLHKRRNPNYSQTQIEVLLHEELGSKKVLWLHSGHLIGDDTDGHIDMLARFVNEHTIFHSHCEDPKDPHFADSLAMKIELMGFKNLEESSFQLYPIPMPDALYNKQGDRLPATYLNFIFINGAILIPQYNQEKDEAVLQIFRNFFPKKDIIGINCVPIIQQGGAIHCASMQYY